MSSKATNEGWDSSCTFAPTYLEGKLSLPSSQIFFQKLVKQLMTSLFSSCSTSVEPKSMTPCWCSSSASVEPKSMTPHWFLITPTSPSQVLSCDFDLVQLQCGMYCKPWGRHPFRHLQNTIGQDASCQKWYQRHQAQ